MIIIILLERIIRDSFLNVEIAFNIKLLSKPYFSKKSRTIIVSKRIIL
jgi:hypothetical protein